LAAFLFLPPTISIQIVFGDEVGVKTMKLAGFAGRSRRQSRADTAYAW
jgi:hypothetical protein